MPGLQPSNDNLPDIDARNPNPPLEDLPSNDVENDLIKDRIKEETKLNTLVKQAKTELFQTSSITPGFFKDQLIIDLNSVTAVTRIPLAPPVTRTAFTKELKEVNIKRHMFTSDLEVTVDSTVSPTITIARLKHRDARKALRIIAGLIIATKQGLDVAKLNPSKSIVANLEILGETKVKRKP